ncbi:MAG: enoyl-CoA hydratase/isomerase family protein [Acidimicrobiia bacterium]
MSDDSEAPVVVTVDNGVATVMLNRPDRLNAMNGAAIRLLSQAYADIDRDDAVRVAVLTGAGRAFCAGADLSRPGGAFKAPRDVSAYRSSPPRPMAFQIRKPVIAAINGHAIGLGMTLAMHCDMRFIAESAMWGIVQVRRGVVPDALSHWTVTRAVGMAAAAEILLTGATLTGPDAVRLGVATRCLPAEEVLPAAIALARDMAQQGSPMSMAMSKRIMWAAADAEIDLIDDLESEAHRRLMGRPDAIEGGAAAHAKRAPVWSSSVSRDWPDDGLFAPAADNESWPPPRV